MFGPSCAKVAQGVLPETEQLSIEQDPESKGGKQDGDHDGELPRNRRGNEAIARLPSNEKLFGSMAGYALTRFSYKIRFLKWKNSDIAFWIISQRMLPPVVVVLPFLIMYRVVGLVDTYLGMILAYTVFNLPFAVWIMRDFFANLPVDLEESALIEGASRFKAFRLIVIPLAAPGLVATFLFCMMFAWNDYLFALMLTFSRASTLPMYIAGEGTQSYGPQWWYLSALSLMAVVPMMIVAVFVERFISRGLVVGAIK